jgi:hypothetical protein
MIVPPYTTAEKQNLCFGMLKYLFYLYMCDGFTGYTNKLKEAFLSDVPNLLNALDPGVTNTLEELARNDTLKGEVMNDN